MTNFEFHVPTDVLFGKGAVDELGEKIKEYTDSVLLVYGGGSIKKSGIYDAVRGTLEKNGIGITELSGVKPNPRIESVRQGAELCKEHKIGGVLAVGGGSSIDCAKIIAAGALYQNDPWDLVLDSSKIKRALPVFSVLTLAATGSEMDWAAVISDLNTNEKYGTHSTSLIPTISVLDPTYTFSVPKKHTAAGIADIMSHTFENYFTEEPGYLQGEMAKAVLKTCIKFGPILMKDPENYEARANIMWASSWAINGLLNKGCAVKWSVHPMEHELSAFYDVTHGEGLAVLTPSWMRYVLTTENAWKFAEYGREVLGISDEYSEMVAAERAIEETEKFFTEKMGLPGSLKALGIDESKLDIMAEKAVKGKDGNNKELKGFKTLKKEDVKAIYEACL